VVFSAIFSLSILLVAELELFTDYLFCGLFRIFCHPRRRVLAVPKKTCRKNRKGTQFHNGEFAQTDHTIAQDLKAGLRAFFQSVRSWNVFDVSFRP
jgi:hypothetical protein